MILEDRFCDTKYLFRRAFDCPPCSSVKHGDIGILAIIFVCRKVDFIGPNVQNERAFIDANFLDQSSTLFVLSQTAFYNAHDNPCFALEVLRGRSTRLYRQ